MKTNLSFVKLGIFGCAFLLWLSACTKTIVTERCENLKIAMMTSNVTMAKTAINHYVNMLPSKAYTQQNVEKLVNIIESSCPCTAELLCFDCITTLPSQTEIWVSFTSGGSATTRIFDLSYTTSNRIEIRTMHE